jgi:hypothetical protein
MRCGSLEWNLRMSESGLNLSKRGVRWLKALKRVRHEMIPLLELFAICDDVFTEADAFDKEYVYKSLGRIHRQWKETRAALDPDFDPESYPKRPRSRKRGVVRKGLALDSLISSMGTTSTSGKSRKKSGKRGKTGA